MSQPSNWPLPAGSSRIRLPQEVVSQLRQHPFSKDFYPLAFGHYLDAQGHLVKRAIHSNYLLIFCHQGRGYYETEQARGELQAGQLLLLPKHCKHRYQAHSEHPWSIYWAHFDGPAAASCMDILGTSPDKPVITLPDWRELRSDVTALLNLQHQRLTLAQAQLAATLLRKLLLDIANIRQRARQVSHFDLLALERWMKDNLHRSLSLADFADFVGLSRFHFSKKFRQKTGTTALHYFNDLKIKQACRLLDQSQQTVRQIAADLGFDDPYYFSRLFKKVMGLSPQHYRNHRIGEQELPST
ncbi:AraC family transcriptional regulator [Idiomarina xiamenensis]|uniref:AraC family transcriptional regulator n=1 Tax=Idiomarina xiamenensis 10-D-4 TaxID=740709 RepID=K2JMZ3_9GAMM|nr:AraC family transcriptional regulator [Idiomarina xiamenensis]EKE84881.1 AraC family transcriptional regulator [Idiomarina xiamenensis 10-D-4]